MTPSRVHFILLIHGLYGSPSNLAVLKEELLRSASSAGTGDLEVIVNITKSFTGSHTWDGVDVNAHRAAEEVDEEIDRLESGGKEVVAFSVMGYSLGGLVARYLVGLLHSRTPSFFHQYRPASFTTAATPHLGVLKYGSRTNTIVHSIGRRLFSRSGQQLYGLDKEGEWDGRSLLEVMADPDEIFLEALKLFPRIQIVANGCHDMTVPYPTATFSLSDPFEAFESTGLQIDVDDNHIVKSWHLPDQRTPSSPFVVRRGGVEVRDPRRRPRFPPFLQLRWPFTYLLFIMIPILVPLWLLTASCVLTYHSFQSRRRHRIHRSQSISPSADSVPLLTPLSNPRLSSLKSSRSTASISSKSSSRRRLRSSSPLSGTETPPMTDLPGNTRHIPGQTPLLLTAKQKAMVANLNRELPQVERLIAWFPWAFNAHALLIVRDVKRFTWHDEARGVVRAWADFVVSSVNDDGEALFSRAGNEEEDAVNAML